MNNLKSSTKSSTKSKAKLIPKTSTKTDTQSSLRTSATRKQYSATFKAHIVLEALRETKTIAQLASEHQLHPNLVTKWKQEAIAELPVVFERKNAQGQAQAVQEQKVAQLYEQIGRLTTQLTWIKKKSGLEPDL
jgi:transposase